MYSYSCGSAVDLMIAVTPADAQNSSSLHVKRHSLPLLFGASHVYAKIIHSAVSIENVQRWQIPKRALHSPQRVLLVLSMIHFIVHFTQRTI